MVDDEVELEDEFLQNGGYFLLYRMYRYGGAPLRFGITNRDFDTRFAEYCRDVEHSVWCPSEVDMSLTTIEPLGRMSRAQAERIERAAIADVGGTLANDEFNDGRGREWRRQLRRQRAMQGRVSASTVMPLDFLTAGLYRYAHVIVLAVLWVIALVVIVRALAGSF